MLTKCIFCLLGRHPGVLWHVHHQLVLQCLLENFLFSYLPSFSFYRQFICDYTTVAACLNHRASPAQRWWSSLWTTALETAFNKLKIPDPFSSQTSISSLSLRFYASDKVGDILSKRSAKNQNSIPAASSG